jgi:thioredoxin-like negative regulator of GroEL
METMVTFSFRRAPRTLLQLIATEMEEEDGNSNPITAEDRAELGVHQSLLLAVENAFNHLLGMYAKNRSMEELDLFI